jgi:hypothetical protein
MPFLPPSYINPSLISWSFPVKCSGNAEFSHFHRDNIFMWVGVASLPATLWHAVRRMRVTFCNKNRRHVTAPHAEQSWLSLMQISRINSPDPWFYVSWSGTSFHVNSIVHRIKTCSKNHIFWDVTLDPEEVGSTSVRNVGYYYPNDVSFYRQKICIFSNAVVKISNLTEKDLFSRNPKIQYGLLLTKYFIHV